MSDVVLNNDVDIDYSADDTQCVKDVQKHGKPPNRYDGSDGLQGGIVEPSLHRSMRQHRAPPKLDL